MYTEFNRKNLGDLRGQLTEVLNKFGKEVGIKLVIDGGIGFDASSVKIKLEGTIEGMQTRSERDLELYTHYKVGDTWVTDSGNTINHDTIVIGYEPKNTRYPLIIRKPNGKVYKARYETPKEYYDSLEGNLTLTPSIVAQMNKENLKGE